jgi:ubiquinone biosynthesis UbiH/UbiF/VisC/COQ6 family hydroxylase
VGLVLALLLARARIRVSITQPSKQPSTMASGGPDIRSFALNAASRQLLTELRAWPERACPVQHMQVFGDASGRVAFEASKDPLAWIVDAQDLMAHLQNAVHYAPDITLTSLTQEPQAELMVICEGRESPWHASAGVQREQFAYAQHAVAAHVQCEQAHLNAAWQWMSPSQVCALLPRGESAPGNSMALVWSVSTERAQALRDASPQEFAQALQDVTQGQLGQLELTSQRAVWPLVLSKAPTWHGTMNGSAWVLAGDAAHSVHPLAGQGLNLGLGDAAALAKALSEKPYFKPFSDAKLLRSYERARKSEAALLTMATDGLHRLFSAPDAGWQNMRNWGMQGLDGMMPLKAWVMRQASGLR